MLISIVFLISISDAELFKHSFYNFDVRFYCPQRVLIAAIIDRFEPKSIVKFGNGVQVQGRTAIDWFGAVKLTLVYMKSSSIGENVDKLNISFANTACHGRCFNV